MDWQRATDHLTGPKICQIPGFTLCHGAGLFIGTKAMQICTNPWLDLVILKLFSNLKDFVMLSTGTHTHVSINQGAACDIS